MFRMRKFKNVTMDNVYEMRRRKEKTENSVILTPASK